MAWDVFKRVKNAVYTTAENYGVSVDMSDSDSKTDTERVTVATGEAFVEMGLTEDEALSLIMHSAAHEGAHVKLSDTSPVRDCLKQAKSDGANIKKLGAMINIAEDYRVDSVISDERPGYWQERSDMSEITKKLFKDKPSPDLEFNTLKAASALTHGIDLHDCGWESDVDMTYVPYNKDTKEVNGYWEVKNITLSAGEIKFRANDDWAISWGGELDNLTTKNGGNITVEAGTYDIKLYAWAEGFAKCVMTKTK